MHIVGIQGVDIVDGFESRTAAYEDEPRKDACYFEQVGRMRQIAILPDGQTKR